MLTSKFKIKVLVGIYGSAFLEIDEPEGILEMDLVDIGHEEWFDYYLLNWLEKKPGSGVNPGKYMFSGYLSASDEDLDYHFTQIKKLEDL